MIDSNGKLTSIDLNTARTIVLNDAALANVEVPTGSVEYVISEWLAKVFLDIDNSVFLSIQKFLYPTGQDIDIQNPGIVRLPAQKASGYLKIDNTHGSSSYVLAINTQMTASNSLVYQNTLSGITVLAGNVGYVYVESVEAGAKTNLPALQTFIAAIPITNPQPLIGGSDLETDAAYWNRIIFLKTNTVSTQTSVAIIKNLLSYYLDAKIYVNNTPNGYVTPITIPAGGYNCVVIFPSGVNATAMELQQAINTLVALAEFVGTNNVSTPNHPIVFGLSYSGVFPVAYSLSPAQAVKTTIELDVSVKFDNSIIALEKPNLAQVFANNFINRLMATFYSTDGIYNLTFTPILGLPTNYNTPVSGIVKSQNNIAPFVSIEAIRSIVYDQSDSVSIKGLKYDSCDNLTVTFNPLVNGESDVVLSIHAPYEGSLLAVDFAKDSLFSDMTSWYDRFIVLDPALITVKVTEV